MCGSLLSLVMNIKFFHSEFHFRSDLEIATRKWELISIFIFLCISEIYTIPYVSGKKSLLCFYFLFSFNIKSHKMMGGNNRFQDRQWK